MTTLRSNIAFLGFGEAAQAFVQGFRQEGVSANFTGYDVKTSGADATSKTRDFSDYNVEQHASCADAIAGSQLIFSMVTADQAQAAAHIAAQAPLNGTLFLDCNSCAPNTKRRSAQLIEDAGGLYVDVAVMAPVSGKLHKTPCLVSGPHAKAAQVQLDKLGMDVKAVGIDIGDASTPKMIRSIMIKGLEALTLECFLAARKAGIEDQIVTSLNGGFHGFNWQERAPYMMERVATHGIRRAAEMEEVVQTLRDLGLSPTMTESTVSMQRSIGALGLKVSEDDAADLPGLADCILDAMTARDEGKE